MWRVRRTRVVVVSSPRAASPPRAYGAVRCRIGLAGPAPGSANVRRMRRRVASVVSLGLLILIQTVKDRSNRRRRRSSSSSNNNDDDDDRLARTLSGTRDADQEAIVDHDTEQDGIMRRMAVANDDADHHPNAEPAKDDHSFSMVMLPLALYLVAFLGQAWMVRIIEMPWFLTMTFLGLAVCGMSCGIAQAHGARVVQFEFHSPWPKMNTGSLR